MHFFKAIIIKIKKYQETSAIRIPDRRLNTCIIIWDCTKKFQGTVFVRFLMSDMLVLYKDYMQSTHQLSHLIIFHLDCLE